MINPYILKHTSRKAPAQFVDVFLRDYFNICQLNRGTRNAFTPAYSMLVHNLENETVFPVWVVKTNDGYYITHAPNKASKERYDNIQMLTEEPTNPRLRRVGATLHSFSHYARAEDVVQTALRSLRGWYALELPRDPCCALFLAEKAGGYGVIDPYGKAIVPPIYRHIIPMSLTSDQISLLICRKDDKDANTTDVYDINGNCIYRNIGGLYRHKDTVKYELDRTEGNRPCIRFAEEVGIVMYDEQYARPKTYVRAGHLLCFGAVEEKDGCPKRLHGMEDRPTTARETDAFDLLELSDVLAPMVDVVAAWRNETPEEVMLSIPVWNVARQTENPLKGVTADTSLIDVPDLSIACFELLQRAGIHTALALANADLFPLCENLDDNLMLELCLLQGQILTTLKANHQEV